MQERRQEIYWIFKVVVLKLYVLVSQPPFSFSKVDSIIIRIAYYSTIETFQNRELQKKTKLNCFPGQIGCLWMNQKLIENYKYCILSHLVSLGDSKRRKNIQNSRFSHCSDVLNSWTINVLRSIVQYITNLLEQVQHNTQAAWLAKWHFLMNRWTMFFLLYTGCIILK